MRRYRPRLRLDVSLPIMCMIPSFVDHDVGGVHRYSRPSLDADIFAALAEVSFDHDRFISRGGSYDFGPM